MEDCVAVKKNKELLQVYYDRDKYLEYVIK